MMKISTYKVFGRGSRYKEIVTEGVIQSRYKVLVEKWRLNEDITFCYNFIKTKK